MKKSEHTLSSLPIVKISWVVHNREYEIGIQHFMAELGVEVSEKEILSVVNKLLSKQ